MPRDEGSFPESLPFDPYALLPELLQQPARYVGSTLSSLARRANPGGEYGGPVSGGTGISLADLIPKSKAEVGLTLAGMIPGGKLAKALRRLPKASDLFHGTSSRNLREIWEEGIAPSGTAYASPFPEIADDVARERVFGLNPSGDIAAGGAAQGGKPALVVLDRDELRRAGVKFERDPEMNWNRENWRDVGGLMTTAYSPSIPPDAIKRAYVGEEQIKKAVAEYSKLKERLAKKSGR